MYALSYVEQDAVARLYDLSRSWRADDIGAGYTQSNVDTGAVSFKLFRCPAAPTSRRPAGSKATETKPNKISLAGVVMGPMDYVIMHQLRHRFYLATNMTNPNGDDNSDLAMNNTRATAIVSITDGTSNTILMMEDGGRMNHYQGRTDNGGTTRDEGIGWSDPDSASGSYDGVYADDNSLLPDNPVTNRTICVMNCNNDSEPYSFHTGGMNIALADGSVRFIRDNIDRATWAALLTARAGDVAGDY